MSRGKRDRGCRGEHGESESHEVDGIHIHLDLHAGGVEAGQDIPGQGVEKTAVIPFQEQLPAVAAPQPEQGGFRRSDDFHLSPHPGQFEQLPRLFGEPVDPLLPFILMDARQAQMNEP
jgi:hypothetical protein